MTFAGLKQKRDREVYMPFDDENYVFVDSVTHRKITADIYSTMRGATHCELEHEPDMTHC